jgi:hypothetical protein
MAIRYYSQFSDQQGTLFTLNIYDDQYGGTSPFEFTVGSDGFRLDYEIEDKFAPICPSTVTVPMLLRNNNDAALLSNLVNSDEGRYVLEIRSAGTTYANGHIFWRGIVLPEFIEVVDEAYPQLVELKAMDDLSNLRTIDYLQSPEGTGYAYTKGHLANALNLVRTWSITADTDRFLFVDSIEALADEVWYAGHQMQLNFSTFKNAETEPATYWSAYEVVEEILLALGCRIYWRPSIDTDVKSIFVIDSWVMHAHDDEDFTGYTVTSNGTLSAQQVHERPQFNLDSTGISRLRGWRHGYLPSIREVRRKFDYLQANPFAVDHVYDHVNADNYLNEFTATLNVVPQLHFSEGSGVSVRLRLNFDIEPDSTPTIGYPMRMIVTMTLKMGQYYAKRSFTRTPDLPFTTPNGNQHALGFSYAEASWETSSVGSFVYFFSPAFSPWQGGSFTVDMGADFPGLPADLTSDDFEVEFKSEIVYIASYGGTAVFTQPADLVNSASIEALTIYPTDIIELQGSTVVFKAVNSSTTGRYKLELPDAKISDRVVNRGGGVFFRPIDGDVFQPTDWRSLADTSEELNLHNVICRDWMKSQPLNIRRMVGTILDHRSSPTQVFSPFVTFTHNTISYGVVAMSYVAGENLWDVELAELKYSGTITTPAVGFEDFIPPTPFTPPGVPIGIQAAEGAIGAVDSVVPLRNGIVSLVADANNFVSVGDDEFEVNVGAVKIMEADDVSARFNVPVTIDLQGETFEVQNAGFPNPLTVNIDSVEAMDLSIISSSGVSAGSLSFFEASDNGTSSIAFRAPASLAGGTSYTLPAADGSNGDVLETNGSGVLSFADFNDKVEGAISNVILSTVDAQGAITSETGFEAKTNAYIKFFELASNGTNNITIKAPTALGGNTTYILPATDGTSGQSLKTDGAGNLYWG